MKTIKSHKATVKKFFERAFPELTIMELRDGGTGIEKLEIYREDELGVMIIFFGQYLTILDYTQKFSCNIGYEKDIEHELGLIF